MPTFTMTKTYQDGNVLFEADLDNMKNSTETFLNTTKIDDDNIQAAGISLNKLASDATVFLVPTGGQMSYAGSTLPSGWLFCDGSAVSRTTFATLFTAISTVYGVGDGSTTFNLPDKRGRISVGMDDMNNTVGTGGGAASVITDASTHGLIGTTQGDLGGGEVVTLSAVQSGTASHNHALTGASTGNQSASHAHKLTALQDDGTGSPALAAGDTINQKNNFATNDFNYNLDGSAVAATLGTSASQDTSHNHTITGNVDNASATAAANAHSNVQPSQMDNWIIKT